jgi:hypothetical protein
MTTFELLCLLTTVLAVVISVTALVRTRRTDKVVADLAAKQLASLDRAERARVVADLVREGPHDWAFHILNRSDVIAREVNFELLDCPASPLVQNDYKQKIPASALAPGGRIRLVAGVHMGSPTTYRARVAWMNPDSTTDSQEYSPSL